MAPRATITFKGFETCWHIVAMCTLHTHLEKSAFISRCAYMGAQRVMVHMHSFRMVAVGHMGGGGADGAFGECLGGGGRMVVVLHSGGVGEL